MEVKLTSHFQKLHFLQNLVQVLTRSTIAILTKLSNIYRKLLYHTSLLIWGVFRGQKTEAVTSLLQEQKILNEYVPNNITDYFQVPDLTVNKWVKDFMKQKFNECFAVQLRNELESRNELENITIKFLLLKMKPLHAGC